ncbi:unnamed protein product [Orchesella dallaii]|uniref:Uncharacterized protein n=2 Tax=Orchesella dallaii TaxID=48710 RepID=A0ABP1PXW9_9HEXA
MDFKNTDLYDSIEDYEHLAQIHGARPRFKTPVQLMKLQTGEGCQFEADDFAFNNEFDNEEEVYDEDIMSMFCFGDPNMKDKQTEVNHFDVERFAHIDFMETEKLMSPLNPEKTVMKMIIRQGSDQKVPERSKLYIHYIAIVRVRLKFLIQQ